MKSKADFIAEGRAEGRVEARIEIAQNMIRQGFSLDVISSATNLSSTELKAIIQENETSTV